jgi:peptidoglycan hydrolase CwlO-like protein
MNFLEEDLALLQEQIVSLQAMLQDKEDWFLMLEQELIETKQEMCRLNEEIQGLSRIGCDRPISRY